MEYAKCTYFPSGVIGINDLISSSVGDLLPMHQPVFRIYHIFDYDNDSKLFISLGNINHNTVEELQGFVPNKEQK